MLVQQSDGHLLQRSGHRRDLGEDVDAIAVVVDHGLEPSHLALDAPQPALVAVLVVRVAPHGSSRLDLSVSATLYPSRVIRSKRTGPSLLQPGCSKPKVR